MIALTFDALFTLYLGLTLLSIFGFWLYFHYRSRKKIVLPDKKRLFVCEFCHFSFLQEPLKSTHRCPQCHCYIHSIPKNRRN